MFANLEYWLDYRNISHANINRLEGPLKGGSGAMCYVQNSLACYVLCKTP